MADRNLIRDMIQSYFRIVDAREFEDLRTIFHEKIVYERPNYKPIQGIDSLVHFYKHVRVLVSGTHTVEGLIIDGNQCACWGRFVGEHRNGKPVDVRFADIFHVEDARIIKRITYFYRPAV